MFRFVILSLTVLFLGTFEESKAAFHDGTPEALAKQFFTPTMEEHVRAYIIQAIREIPEEERNNVLRCARELITPSISGFHKSRIIHILGLISVGQRRAACAEALRQFHEAGAASQGEADEQGDAMTQFLWTYTLQAHDGDHQNP